jgi:hypothetical protein
MANLLRFDFNDRDGIFEVVENGDWVRATDYDALAAKLAVAERRERQLLDTTATCRMLLRELNTAKAKLAEVEAELANGSFYQEKDIDALQARADAAEAALPAVYRLGLEDVYRLMRPMLRSLIAREHAMQNIRALPTPTAAELMARIQTGEKE